MTTTELIKLLQDNEKGGATGRSREISFDVNGEYIFEPNIHVESTEDGIAGAGICLRLEEEKCCGKCEYHSITVTGLRSECFCDNKDSEKYAEYTEYFDSCKEWREIDD